MRFPLVALLLLPTVFCARTNASESALRALRLLPKGEGKHLARIEARGGTPVPERWHILVHDPADENGLHEYVVAGGELVASRSLSQFVENLAPGDVVSTDAIKIDSDRAGRLAQRYAVANNLTVAGMNYGLKKDGPAAAPLWTVTCLDDAGNELGRLVVSAGKGNVISNEGFAVPPAVEKTSKPERIRTPASTQPATQIAVEQPEPPVETAEPPRREEERRPGVFRRAGGSLQRIFTGRNTIGR